MTVQEKDNVEASFSSVGRVSSPASTGGAGTLFEQHVDAYWLAQLLVQSIPPILIDCSVVEVRLQTEHLGWHTDDFLIIGQNGAGSQCKLVGQVKRTFRVSAADEECKKAIDDFWLDFSSGGLFSSDTDRFALVTLRGTNTLLEHFVGLLDCARAARDGAEFEHRLATAGFIATKAVDYCTELRTIVGAIEGRSVTAAEIWPFLRVLHALSLDLDTSTRQTEVMIKNLLAHTAANSDAVSAADTSWNALLAIAADAMAEAHSFRRDDLPDSLRQRHSVVGGTEPRALQALKDHTDLILRGIRSTIGSDLHLRRAGLVQQVLGQMESTQVVLVSGPAGSGKSAVAKDAITLLSKDHFAFSFRAEELAQPHFDATLQNAQIPVNAATLRAILAGQSRKVLLIESVERLLEKSTRDAFSDLLTLATEDKSLRIVLTCRDYSTDLVHASFLASARIDHFVVVIPELDDAELAEVEASLSVVARPLANPALRRVLRNPYYLDKALQISWLVDRPLPESEREFRTIFWQQVVRADDRPAAGAPRRREEAFEEIAVRRARVLTAYVTCNDLDTAIVDSLRHDSLIASPDQSGALVAPAHDVLEDWAILQWIEGQYLTNEGSFRALSQAIGAHPAMRRAYRKWVAELIEHDLGAADRLFNDAVAEAGVPAQFRDDTLVSLLRAPSSPAFLERHGAELLANNKDFLRQAILLLRVACVTTPTELQAAAGYGSLFNIPDGPAWASILQLVQTHIEEFATTDHLLLLGFIEDWARGVSQWVPYPDGAVSAAAIAHWLLPDFDTYESDGAGQRTLRVIAKIPKTDAARFEALLRGAGEEEKRDRTAHTFRDIVFSGLEGTPAARDLPDLIVSVGSDYLLCSEAGLHRNRYHGGSSDLGTLFGVNEGLDYNYFPASAYRGPWLSLLQYHPSEGLGFLITVFNHSADWYAHPRVAERIEPPFEIELTFADGTSRRQWGNPRLWNLYRGTSVGPYVLQSLLMALERWLLEFAEMHPEQLDAVLLHILQQSDTAALTAVVASVATAFPLASGGTLLVLLRSLMCIQFDLQRMVADYAAPSSRLGSMLGSRAEHKIYEDEREEADARPHRRQNLETAIMNLQLGPLAASVHEIIDQHRGALRPASEQSDHDRVWRLSLHRMDLRQYSVAEVAATDGLSASEVDPDEPARRQVRLDPNKPEQDVKEMVDKSAAQFGAMNARLGLLMWALHVFKNEESATYDPAQWRQQLSQARTSKVVTLTDEESDIARGGPGMVAAVCVRDHWQDMSADERDWCVDMVCSEVMRQANAWDSLERVQRFDMSHDRSCAWVVSVLIGESLSETQRLVVQQTFVNALTHSIDEVRWYAAWGIAERLWSIDRELAMRCVNALATEATLIDLVRDTIDDQRPSDQRRKTDEILAEAASAVRQQFWQPGGIAEDAYQKLDTTEWFGAEANGRILAILSRVPAEPAAIAGFTRATQTLVEWWDSDSDHRGRDGARSERDYDSESAVSGLLQSFLMRASACVARTVLQPMLGAVDRHPREISLVVQGLVGLEDREPNTQQFWFVWELFADRVRRAKWLTWLDDDHPIGDEMVSAIFLGNWWKEEVRHWRSLEGHAHHVHRLFEDLPPCCVVLDDYVRFLYHIGEQSLPEAFVRIAKRLQSGDAQRMLRKTNTVFLLEVLLQRHVYGRPLELKHNSAIRDAVLLLLDLLVENGSSAAFRMRDDFVTPPSVT